jgi:Rieske Fe-S protein
MTLAVFDQRVARRIILRTGIGLGLSACLESHGVAQDNPAVARPKADDLLVQVGDTSRTPLTPTDIAAGNKQIFAWAMDPTDSTVRSGSRLNRVLLIRLNPEDLTAETSERAVAGVVAYSAICPHNGCEITEWIPAEQSLYCPCHASKFEPGDSGKVLDGPAPNALPGLPLKLVDGKLVVAKAFTARITFEQG